MYLYIKSPNLIGITPLPSYACLTINFYISSSEIYLIQTFNSFAFWFNA